MCMLCNGSHQVFVERLGKLVESACPICVGAIRPNLGSFSDDPNVSKVQKMFFRNSLKQSVHNGFQVINSHPV